AGLMRVSPLCFLIAALPCVVCAQVTIAGRVVDETGAGVGGARIELKGGGATVAAASSDRAGNFHVSLPVAGEYGIQAERLGFYLFKGAQQTFSGDTSEL